MAGLVDWSPLRHQRHSAHLKTEPSLAKTAEGSLRRTKSEANYATAPARHQTVITDPKFLEELRKLKEARAKAPSSPVAQLKATESEEISAQLPEEGWIFSASEEPFTRRSWRKHGGTEEEEPDLVARVASDWGVAATCCKGRKSKGDCSVGQDNFLIAKLPNEWMVLCVFDGHGVDGHWPAQRITETVPHFLQEEPCAEWLKSGDADKALTHAFKEAEAELEAFAVEMGKDLDLCGSTATVALIPKSRDAVWVATVGDSRAILLDQRRVLHETSDHKATRKDEAERIKSAGGRVINTEYDDGTEDSRITPKDLVSPQIAISRSMGDLIFKDSGVTAEPEIVHWSSFSNHETYLVICSDGVWEFLSSEDVQNFLRDSLANTSSAPEVANGLLHLAQKTWKQHEAFYCDDITVVLASLRGSLPVKTPPAKKPCPGCENPSCFSQ